MTTPERALELANLIGRLTGPCFAELSPGTAKEAAAVLRHYAELSQKWQAVLDAEPLGILVNVPGSYLVTWDEQAMLKSYQGTCRLIIKPAP